MNKFSLLIILACVFGITLQDYSYETTVFLVADRSDLPEFLGPPARIQVVSGGLYFYDDAFHRFIRINRKGEKQYGFGKAGYIPERFQSVAGFRVLDEQYVVYDHIGEKRLTYDSTAHVEEEVPLDSFRLDKLENIFFKLNLLYKK